MNRKSIKYTVWAAYGKKVLGKFGGLEGML